MARPVKLSDIVFALDLGGLETMAYVDRETGEVLPIPEEVLSAAEDGRGLADHWGDELERFAYLIVKDVKNERFIPLPDSSEVDEWSVMEDFALSQSDQRVRNRLLSALRGRRPFRRFKDAVHSLGLRDAWHRYHDEALKHFAQRWCEDNDLPWIDDMAAEEGEKKSTTATKPLRLVHSASEKAAPQDRADGETDLRYPIGRFEPPKQVDAKLREAWIRELEALPRRLALVVEGCTDEQLDTPYRPEGWTVRQVVHHLADSHVNAYVRFRLALTEEKPTVKPFDEAAWAELPDALRESCLISVNLLDALHQRWVALLRSLQPADFSRTFRHPEHEGELSLDWLLALYAWHGRHHLAQIISLCRRMGWSVPPEALEALEEEK